MRLLLSALALAAIGLAVPASAMDGVNVDTGDAITVDDGTNFNVGDVIAVYDTDGNEMDVEIQSVNDNGTTVDLDVVDQDSGDGASLEFTK